jgi:lipid-binding SYLF domain-containing protein
MTAFAKDMTPAEKRAKIDAASKDSLNSLLAEKKDAKALYDKAYGYAVFTDTKVSFGISGGGGAGAAIVKGSGKKTYMKMATGGAGLSVGVQKLKIIFLFETKEVFDKFVESGWQGGAGAAAAAGDEGMNKSAAFKNGVAVWQFTKKGFVLSAELSGSKFWKDDELN